MAAQFNPMKLKELVLRCFAEREADGSWFAMCLELNLYSRGGSFEEDRKNLHSAISSYLRDAVTKDREYIADLIPRPAPLYFWLRYLFIWCCVKFRDATAFRKFNEAMPLVPA